jgi:hypothetical protein
MILPHRSKDRACNDRRRLEAGDVLLRLRRQRRLARNSSHVMAAAPQPRPPPPGVPMTSGRRRMFPCRSRRSAVLGTPNDRPPCWLPPRAPADRFRDDIGPRLVLYLNGDDARRSAVGNPGFPPGEIRSAWRARPSSWLSRIRMRADGLVPPDRNAQPPAR